MFKGNMQAKSEHVVYKQQTCSVGKHPVPQMRKRSALFGMLREHKESVTIWDICFRTSRGHPLGVREDGKINFYHHTFSNDQCAPKSTKNDNAMHI